MKVGKYAERALRVATVVAAKQEAYGDSFTRSSDVLVALFPGGIAANRFCDALAIVRVVDKLFRVANQKDAFGEDPWEDIAGYALLSMKDKPPAEDK